MMIRHFHHSAVAVLIHEIPANFTQITANGRPTNTFIFPDSRAGICVASPKHLQSLGISIEELNPTKKKVFAVEFNTHLLRKHPHQTYHQRDIDKLETIYMPKGKQSVLQPWSPHINMNLAIHISLLQGSESRNQLYWRKTIATRQKKTKNNTVY